MSNTSISYTSLGSYKSHVNRKGNSFKTTIPIFVAKALALDHKDEINWEIGIEKDLPFVIVRKVVGT